VVDRLKVFLACSLITVQNLVVSHTTCAHVESRKTWGGRWAQLGGEPGYRKHYFPTCVITPNIAQTVWAYVGSRKFRGRWGPPLGTGASLSH